MVAPVVTTWHRTIRTGQVVLSLTWRDMHIIIWQERDGRHVSYAPDHQAARLLDMIRDDASMTLVSVETR